ncbi:MAG: hypothetical protein AAGA09_06925 [Pseudomonadota bacterium]
MGATMPPEKKGSFDIFDPPLWVLFLIFVFIFTYLVTTTPISGSLADTVVVHALALGAAMIVFYAVPAIIRRLLHKCSNFNAEEPTLLMFSIKSICFLAGAAIAFRIIDGAAT